MGLQLDGVKRFRNLTEANPAVGQLHVYDDPKFHEFQEPEMLKPFKNGDEFVNIKVAKTSFSIVRLLVIK